MNVKELTLESPDYPKKLRTVAQPPQQLFVIGQNVKELLARPCVTIVGSRKVTAYGKAVTTQLATELAKAGIVIISGLALGVDSVAHKATLEAGGQTIAVLPSSLDRIYPASHQGLVRQILAQGGALVSEYPSGTPLRPWSFTARNRITSGLADVVVITEAAQKSGTLHTARFALEQGKELLAVPGNITSPTSVGANNLIKSGARPVTDVSDIFHALGLEMTQIEKTAPRGANPEEQRLLNLLFEGMTDGAELLAASQLEITSFNQHLTMLEIRGHIRPLGANQWALSR